MLKHGSFKNLKSLDNGLKVSKKAIFARYLNSKSIIFN